MICENCGKEHDGSYGSGRFCSKECARSYATSNELNKHQLKEAKCVNCGKIIYIDKRASLKTCKCKECSTKQFKCNICGQIYNEDDHHCKNEFCKKHNLKHIKLLIKYFGFDKNKLGTLEVENEYNRIRNIIYNLYWKNNLSSWEISKLFNYPNGNHLIQDIFVIMYIPKRNYKEASKLAILNPNKYNREISYQYKSGWHTTWNNKEVYLRSSYELDYAKELDKQQIDYEVEQLRIKYFNSILNEYKCAIPDFYIPFTNTIVEIKSNYTLNVQEMKDKFKAYKELGYNCKLICDHREMEII